MNISDIFRDMITRDITLNAISRELNYSLCEEQKDALRRVALENTKEFYRGKNSDIYRKLTFENEVRLEYLSGRPCIDFPMFPGVAVNTVDFMLEPTKKNSLRSYQYRKGAIRYKFNFDYMTEVEEGMFIVTSLIKDGGRIAISRIDGKPGYIEISEEGTILHSKIADDLFPLGYAVAGVRNGRLILHFNRL